MKLNKIRLILFRIYSAMVITLNVVALPVLADNDPLTVVNNFSDFMFGMVRALGMILLGFGIVQVGLSLKSHDPSQRCYSHKILTLDGYTKVSLDSYSTCRCIHL